MQDFINKKVLLGVCGGIAAYKTAYLVRELTTLGAQVRVVMTDAAQQFMTPMTFQALSGQAVRTSLFDSEAERAMGHIELARWADYLVIAPASADLMAKMAHGLADDLLSTLYLVAETPVIVCPAMNRSMWAHPATVSNRHRLIEHGVLIVGPEEGEQACGEVGFGRMSEPSSIITALRLCHIQPVLQGRHVVITAGPTREAIDPVRYLTNHSSGKMGYALASAAKAAGAEVTLISGPSALSPPLGVTLCRVESAQAMTDAVMASLTTESIFIGAAAVADYTVAAPQVTKLKKSDTMDELVLSLTKTTDMIASVAQSQKAAFVVGFAAETHDVLNHAKEKLIKKQLDMVIANQVGQGMGFDTEDNQVTIVTQQNCLTLPKTHKTRLAADIIMAIHQSESHP